MRREIPKYLLLIFLTLLSYTSRASHIFGLDFYYTHISGNTYAVNLVIYGDCSGAAFPTFPTSTPQVKIYNGSALVNTITLAIQPPAAGVEVTPVCPAQAGNTTCVNPAGTIPGIKKFVYTGNVTLPGTSPVWRFIFTGNMGGGMSAGRSISITNVIMGPSGSTIQLTDTLNNTVYSNNGAVYTTIPTPFYCINRPATFNPGAVDADGDSLVYGLAPGIDAATGVSLPYISPYTPTFPLGTAPGTYSFNTATGQMSFTPNISQKSLVVYNVREFRGGVFVGTTQREMTVVTETCTNTPPSGVISAPSAGTLVSPTQLNLCGNTGAFNFHINPSDPDGDTITMTASGLPAGATLDIVNNTTLAPLATFTWNTTGVTPGLYTFYVTYQDHGCPLTASQTIAYTINVLPVPTAAITVLSQASCVAKAVYKVVPSGVTSPYTVKIMSGATTLSTYAGIYGAITDSLVPGNYAVRITNSEGCTTDIPFTLTPPTPPSVAATGTNPLCYGTSTGVINAAASAGLAPYTYAIGSAAYGASNTFSGLSAGTYTISVKDANSCTASTTVTLTDPSAMHVYAGITSPACAGVPNGSVLLSPFSSTGPYTYAMGSSSYGSSNLFIGLAPGTYTFHIKNANGCILDTTATLADSLTIGLNLTAPAILCNGGSSTVTLNGTGSPVTYTYAYGTSAYGTTNTFPLAAGTYVLHVRDANMCQHDTTITLTQPTPITAPPTATNVVCHGAANGSLSVSASGGTPGYSYSLNGGSFGTTSTFTPLPAGSYTVQVKDANNCLHTAAAAITEPPAITLDSVRVIKPSCFGNTNGSLQLYGHGGASPFTYATGTGIYTSSSTFTGLGAGSYSLHIKDANGCTKDTIVNMIEPAPISVTAGVVRPICSLLSNGSVTLVTSGGTPSYTYASGTGVYGTSPLFSLLATGTYSFHIKDVNGCAKDTTITLTDSLKVGITASALPILCNGGTSLITLSGTGSPASYTYANGSSAYSTTNTFSLTAGTYTLHVRDANMCQHDTTLTLTQPTPLVATPTATNVICHGAGNGSISVSASGGTPGYAYSIGGGSYGTVPTFSPLSAGSYTIKVKDINNCIYTAVATITEPPVIVLDSAHFTKPTCFGNSNGSIQVYSHGGASPYTYAIGGGSYSTTSLFTGLAAGTYVLHTKDANGCVKDTTINLAQPAPLTITANAKRPICNTLANGKVILAATGGTPSYTYAFGTGASSASPVFSPLATGSFVFHVADANGCSRDTTISLTDSLIISATTTTSPVLCYGGTTGSITTSGTGGISPYTYAIGSGSYGTSSTFSGLVSSTYIIHVKDSNGCIYNTSASISQPTPVAPHVALTNPTCNGLNNGSISVTATGGTPTYQYAINTGSYSTTSLFGSLTAGSNTIHVKDNNGCIYDTTVTLIQPDPIAMLLSPTPVSCFGRNDGKVTVNAAGGSSPYAYAADGGSWQPGNVITGLAAAHHLIHLKDNNGCPKDTVVNIAQPLPLKLALDTTNPRCGGSNEGAVSLHANGGTRSYLFSKNNVSFSADSVFNGLSAGAYTFYVRDVNGCNIDSSVALRSYPEVEVRATATPATCYGTANGALLAEGSGGTAPFTYNISGAGINVASDTASGLASGTYIVTVTDSRNCKKETAIEVPQPDPINISLAVAHNICEGFENKGAVMATVTGGSAPYKYAWNTGATGTASIGGLPNGTYQIGVTDANNCAAYDTASVRYTDCCTPFVPDAFTPNGDGKNDVFRIEHQGTMKLLEFNIYNRFGELVFSTSDPTAGWDGYYHGIAADLGVYYYFARIICGTNRTDVKFLKGDVTLIR